MKIVLVCKHNQARSIMMAALMRRFYPDHEVISAGVKADTGELIPLSIRQIADTWGLEVVEDYSQNFIEILGAVSSEDLIFAADSEVADQIEALALHLKPVDITRYAVGSEWSPSDPMNMSLEQTRTELAKALLLTNYCAAPRLGAPLKLFGSVVGGRRGINQALAWQRESDGLIVDVSIRVLDSEEWERSGALLHSYSPRQLSALPAGVNPSVLVPAYESDGSSKILLSQGWADWLFALASRRPLLLFSSSPSEGSQAVEERALGLIHASEFLR